MILPQSKSWLLLLRAKSIKMLQRSEAKSCLQRGPSHTLHLMTVECGDIGVVSLQCCTSCVQKLMPIPTAFHSILVYNSVSHKIYLEASTFVSCCTQIPPLSPSRSRCSNSISSSPLSLLIPLPPPRLALSIFVEKPLRFKRVSSSLLCRQLGVSLLLTLTFFFPLESRKYPLLPVLLACVDGQAGPVVGVAVLGVVAFVKALHEGSQRCEAFGEEGKVHGELCEDVDHGYIVDAAVVGGGAEADEAVCDYWDQAV